MLQAFQGVDVFVQTPMYGNTCFANYHTSLIQTVVEFMNQGITFRTVPRTDSLVQRVRNISTADFLSTPATHMMIIDADIGWDAKDILKLIAADKDIACAIYPKKTYPISWPMNCFRTNGGMVATDPETGFIDIKDGPTGFMLIKRAVIERLIELHPEWRCSFREGGLEANENCYAIFDCFIDPSRMYLSEDFGFCRRAQEAGFRVWCDPTIKLSHCGHHVFQGGCIADQMLLVETGIRTDIDGWTTPEELIWLRSVAQDCDSVAEIGCWKGRSTSALLQGCKGTVHAIDHWRGSPEDMDGAHAEAINRDIFLDFMANVGHAENLVVHRGDSAIVASDVPSVDMVFIDGSHWYENVYGDIEAYKGKARRLICGHDWDREDVKKAVREHFGNDKLLFPAGTIWAVYLD